MESARGIRMTLLDRLIVAFTALFTVAVAVIGGASALGWSGPGSLKPLFDPTGIGPVELGLFSLLLLLAGLHVFFFAVQQEREEGIRQETEIGHVRISLRAIENLVQRTARSVRGIKDVDVRVHPSPEGVAVALSLVVQPELPLPQISQEVGHLVRSKVRETVGVTVGDVAIDVRNIAGASRPARVE